MYVGRFAYLFGYIQLSWNFLCVFDSASIISTKKNGELCNIYSKILDIMYLGNKKRIAFILILLDNTS